MDPQGTGMVLRTLEGTNDTDPAGEDEVVPLYPDFTQTLGTSVRATLGNIRQSLREKQESFTKIGRTIWSHQEKPDSRCQASPATGA